MTSSITIAAMSIALLIGAGHCGAQVPVAAPPSDEQAAGTADDSVVDSVVAAYRELICSRAADASNPHRDHAIDLALQQNYVDDRFNAIIQQSMQNASRPECWNVEELFRATKMLALCTLSPQEQMELVFRCYLECSDSKSDRSLQGKLKQALQKYPDQTSRLVNEQLQQGDVAKNVLPLVDIVGASTEATLPRLMELAKSDDPEVALWAMNWIPGLIKQVRKLNQETRRLDEQRKLGIEGVDSKMVQYAERIIYRYDTDGDQELSPVEYEKMLQSPIAADTDKNGSITVGEYAAWLQSRSRRRE